jgi:uncharacterized protein (TIGR02646 family)
MIRLDLGAEPPALTAERTTRLPVAIAAFNAHGPGHAELTKLLDAGYRVAREELRKRQHGKCAFCEKKEDAFKRPVEHFRPKKGAHDSVAGNWVGVSTHYWWLTWTWENLYFSCDECNRTGNKGSRFPIEAGHARVDAPTQPVSDPIDAKFYDLSAERRLLVDPRSDDPLDHLEWTPVDRTKPKLRWQWTIQGRDQRGTVTIGVLGLNGREDEVNLHLRPLRALWREIANHLAAGRELEAQQSWDAVVATFVEDTDQPFRAAAWWALDSLCSKTDRHANGFRDPPVPSV